MYKKIIIFIFLIILSNLSFCFSWHFRQDYKCKIDIKIINNLIIIPLSINGSNTMYFILDSGVNNLIICELFDDDILQLNYAKTMFLKGLGQGKPIETFYSPINIVTIDNSILNKVDIYVIKKDIFSLSKHLGTKVNGIIGYDLFKDNVIEIDYVNKELIIYNPDTYINKYPNQTIPLIIEKSKIYINASVTLENDSAVEAKFLIDTGGSMSAWISGLNDKRIKLPTKTIDSFLGTGLSGSLHGKIGKVKNIKIVNNIHKNPFVAFPDSSSISSVYKLDKRIGSICGEILRRYTLIFNYQKSEITFNPNYNFNAKFYYNQIGIEVFKPIPRINFYVISNVRINSEAEKAGLKEGDQIIEIDGKFLLHYNLKEVNNIIFSILNEKTKFLIFRNEKEIFINFFVEDKL